MCGRFWSSLTWEQYRDVLGLASPMPETNFAPNWNTAPTHDVLVASVADGERRLENMRWGLIPPWAKEIPKFSTFNAKSETLEEKATWRGSLNKHRCAIAVSGFYEWRGPKGKKQPYAIRRKDGAPMLLAGLWAYNDKIDAGGIRSFAIITCPANNVMGQVHDRMPVILEKDDLDLWLGPEPWNAALRALLRPCADDVLTAIPIGKDVGSVANNAPDLLDPIDGPLF